MKRPAAAALGDEGALAELTKSGASASVAGLVVKRAALKRPAADAALQAGQLGGVGGALKKPSASQASAPPLGQGATPAPSQLSSSSTLTSSASSQPTSSNNFQMVNIPISIDEEVELLSEVWKEPQVMCICHWCVCSCYLLLKLTLAVQRMIELASVGQHLANSNWSSLCCNSGICLVRWQPLLATMLGVCLERSLAAICPRHCKLFGCSPWHFFGMAPGKQSQQKRKSQPCLLEDERPLPKSLKELWGSSPMPQDASSPVHRALSAQSLTGAGFVSGKDEAVASQLDLEESADGGTLAETVLEETASTPRPSSPRPSLPRPSSPRPSEDLEHGVGTGTFTDNDYNSFFEELDKMVVTPDNVAKFEEVIKAAVTPTAVVEEPKLSKLEVVAQTGIFDVRDAVGQQFSRVHAPGSAAHQAYHAIQGRQNKQAFRASWAKATFANVLVGKKHQVSYQVVDTTLGEHMTFGSLVQHLGGWQWAPAVAGAKRLAGKCAKLGGKWISQDAFTELTTFLVLKKQHMDVFEESWLQFQKEFSDKEVKNSGSALLVEAAVDAGVAAVEGSNKATAEQPSKKIAGNKVKKEIDLIKAEPGVAPKKGPGDEGHGLLKEAVRVKALLVKHRSAAQALAGQIQSGHSEYKWANNPENVGILLVGLDTLNGRLNMFASEFLIQDSKIMQLKTGTKWLSELENFVKLKDAIGDVQKQTSMLLSMHNKRG